MNLQEFFATTYKPLEMPPGLDYQHLRPCIHCKDGTTLSVQASRTHYCVPRIGGTGPYNHVEVMPDVAPPETWAEYYDGDWEEGKTGVFGYIPVEIVENFINEHGGIDEDKTFREWL